MDLQIVWVIYSFLYARIAGSIVSLLYRDLLLNLLLIDGSQSSHSSFTWGIFFFYSFWNTLLLLFFSPKPSNKQKWCKPGLLWICDEDLSQNWRRAIWTYGEGSWRSVVMWNWNLICNEAFWTREKSKALLFSL